MSETWIQEGQNNVARRQKKGYQTIRIKPSDLRNVGSEIKKRDIEIDGLSQAARDTSDISVVSRWSRISMVPQ